jgi:hypothetical protein
MTSARSLLAAALVALTIGCASVQEEPELPRSCGLSSSEGWKRLATPPQEAVRAIDAAQAGNPFRDAPGIDSHTLWLANRQRDQIAHCDYSGPAECGVGTTVIFRRGDGAWKQDDDALVTMCSRH